MKTTTNLTNPTYVTITNPAVCIYGSYMILTVNNDYFLNLINELIFVIVKCSVSYAVRIEFLNIIQTSSGFRGFNCKYVIQIKTLRPRNSWHS
jgi:hypothetical protein